MGRGSVLLRPLRPPTRRSARLRGSLLLLVTLYLLALASRIRPAEAVKRPSPSPAAATAAAAPAAPGGVAKGEAAAAAPIKGKRKATGAEEEPGACQAKDVPAPSTGGGGGKASISIQLQLHDAKPPGRQLALPAGTTPTALRRHLLAQGLVSPTEADALRLRRKQGSRPVTQSLAVASVLQEGDVILTASKKPAATTTAATATTGGVASSTDGGNEAGSGPFVPFPQHALKKKGASSSSGGARARSFTDIELYKVAKQDKAHASLVRVDPEALGAFIGRVAEGETRVGLLFGSVDGATKEVSVAAVLEVDGEFQQHGPGHKLDDRGLYLHHRQYHHASGVKVKADEAAAAAAGGKKPKKKAGAGGSASSSSSTHNPEVARAVKVASLLGLRPVGWVVARPGGTEAGTGADASFLNAQEVLVAARLQIEALRDAGRDVGQGFVTLAVNTSHSDASASAPPKKKAGAPPKQKPQPAQHSVEAFQVSEQAVQMAWDGLFDEARAGSRHALPTTSDVFVSGDTRREVDTALFTLPVGIAPLATTAPGAGPSSQLFKRVTPPLGDDEALRELLLGPAPRVARGAAALEPPQRWLDTRPKQLLTKLADFHVLVYLARYLRTAELEKLCLAVRAFGGGGGGGGASKAGGAVGQANVPPAVRALLEALCEEG